MFLLPANEHRSELLHRVRQWLSRANNDPLWLRDDEEADVRALVVVHRMAAKRLGFPNLYSALNDRAPPSLKDGLDDGTTWVLRPFLTYLLPLADAVRSRQDFEVMAALRVNCPLLNEGLAVQDAASVLLRLRESTASLVEMLEPDTQHNIGEILNFAVDRELVTLDDRFDPYVGIQRAAVDPEVIPEANNVIAFLNCSAKELSSYRRYIEDHSPFATQQGVKGAEFDRVLVIIDDEEGRGQTNFSYGKYLGITPLSEKDQENINDGQDSVLGRTRRLFYVCCSRAVTDLAVVIFLPDVDAARAVIEAKGIFPVEDILSEADIEI